MKKVLPESRPLKPLPRKMTDVISALVVLCTVLALLIATKLTYPQDNISVSAGNFAIYKGSENKEAAALMFNVYEGADTVREILDILRRYTAKATFFIGGIWAEDNADVIREIEDAGHEIGSHGYAHKDHAKLSLEHNKEEMVKTNRLLRDITGKAVTLFAPPSGSFGENTVTACRALGQKMILWTKDTIDWRDKDIPLLVKRATKNIKNGDLILMHPKPQTVSALPQIIESYLAKGLSLLTVSEVIV